jgi:hypothetical protein
MQKTIIEHFSLSNPQNKAYKLVKVKQGKDLSSL